MGQGSTSAHPQKPRKYRGRNTAQLVGALWNEKRA